MGLLDEILKQAGSAAVGAGGGGGQHAGLGSIAELVMKNPQIVSAALSMLNPKDGEYTSLLTSKWSPINRLGSIEPVGILNAWTAKVRMNSARITATTIDSRYSRKTDFLNASSGSGAGLLLIPPILAEAARLLA